MIEATLYYAEKLPEVKKIFEGIEGSEILIVESKKALENKKLASNLLSILMQYSSHSKYAIEMEAPGYSIDEVIETISLIYLGPDYCNFKNNLMKIF